MCFQNEMNEITKAAYNTPARRYQMVSVKPDNIETASKSKMTPMLLTDGKDYRCSECGQRLTDDAKGCPLCKAVFSGTAKIIPKAEIVPGSQEYMKLLEQRYQKLREEMGEEDFNRFLKTRRLTKQNYAKKTSMTEKKNSGSSPAFIWVLLGAAISILLFLLISKMFSGVI